ncbi:class I SAM-dependent methyltransferase [Sinorhizobium meliloti]|nr:class I SAM-dependent methyltransferase [Sinorhizobium meliloti]
MTHEFDSGSYWQHRYVSGRDSGDGSYGKLAQFKAEFLNRFVSAEGITSVIELGCGDGAQLALAEYPLYIGTDISRAALDICRRAFDDDLTKCFLAYNLAQEIGKQELALSLDVIFHLVEDGIFERYMRDLFAAASRFVIIYSSDYEDLGASTHVRHRRFTRWAIAEAPDWQLIQHQKNPYAEKLDCQNTSFSDFFVYKHIPTQRNGR